MKRLNLWRIALALVACCVLRVPEARAQLTIISLTVTNTPTNGDTITVNGTAYLWTNGVVTPSTQIQTTNTIVAVTTNLFNQLVYNPFAGVQISANSTNGVFLQSVNNALTVVCKTNWALLVTNIYPITNAYNVRVPASSYLAADATNIESQLVADLNAFSTNALNQNQPIAQQLVGTTNTQSISNKTLVAPMITGGTNVGGVLSNSPGISGNAALITNGEFIGATNFNEQLMTNDISGIGSDFTIFSFGSDPFNVYNGVPFRLRFRNSLNFTNGSGGVQMGIDAVEFDNGGNYISGSSTPFFIGTFSGNATYLTNIPPQNLANGNVPAVLALTNAGNIYQGSASNLTLTGTNFVGGNIVVPAGANSSLVNSNNADLPYGTNNYIRLSGPTGPFYIAGIVAGLTDQELRLENGTGQIMVIGNQSGVETTAANRIITCWGTDRQFTNNPAIVGFKYNGSRWVIESVN